MKKYSEGAKVSRAKFHCDSETNYGGRTWREYKFSAVCADEVDENQRFHKATPNGSLTITVDNPGVVFEPGKSYYLDFTEVVETDEEAPPSETTS
jgi:hypothetical protein